MNPNKCQHSIFREGTFHSVQCSRNPLKDDIHCRQHSEKEDEKGTFRRYLATQWHTILILEVVRETPRGYRLKKGRMVMESSQEPIFETFDQAKAHLVERILVEIKMAERTMKGVEALKERA